MKKYQLRAIHTETKKETAFQIWSSNITLHIALLLVEQKLLVYLHYQK